MQKKKGTEKKKSILELFREELRRSQENRKDRHGQRSKGPSEGGGGRGEEREEREGEREEDLPLEPPPILPDPEDPEDFKVDEYKELGKGSFDIGDPLTTNLYVGNINPKVYESDRGKSKVWSEIGERDMVGARYNINVAVLTFQMNEEMLCQQFGKFGSLASVKVMWPRTEEERARNKNCGFVAFMKREDAEKALDTMKGTAHTMSV